MNGSRAAPPQPTVEAPPRFAAALRRAREARDGPTRSLATVTPDEARAADGGRAASGSPPRGADAAPAPELAAVIRTLPPAIAARPLDGVPLRLSFGRSLEVELRRGTAGVEVVLRPDRHLLAAAEAELPRVVAALRARGVAVARASVRGRERPAGRAR